MTTRLLRKTKGNKNWMKGFIVHKSNKDLPIHNYENHAYSSGTHNIKSNNVKE